MKILYDGKCRELAEHFLSGDKNPNPPGGRFATEEAEKEDLACHIQQAVEDWFRAQEPTGA